MYARKRESNGARGAKRPSLTTCPHPSTTALKAAAAVSSTRGSTTGCSHKFLIDLAVSDLALVAHGVRTVDDVWQSWTVAGVAGRSKTSTAGSEFLLASVAIFVAPGCV